MTLAELVIHARETCRRSAPNGFAALLGLSESELVEVELGAATVANERAEHWAELLQGSRIVFVQAAIAARDKGLRQIEEDKSVRSARKRGV